MLQRVEKSTGELTKINGELHTETSDDEVAADYDSVLKYEDQAAGALGLMRHNILELSHPPTTGTGIRVQPPPILSNSGMHSAENGPQIDDKVAVILGRVPPQRASDSRLSDIDKFQYLRSLLDGPAAKAITGILTTETSYTDAIEILKERFGNAKIIEAQHFENLRTLTPASNDRNLKPTVEEDLEDLLQYFRVEVDCMERTAHGPLEVSSKQYLLPGSGRRKTPSSSAAVLKNSATGTCVFCERGKSGRLKEGEASCNIRVRLRLGPLLEKASAHGKRQLFPVHY
ncbi:hypothetical protein HPB49_003666 [Dermacentor silvarum]|uniref:Uncharacterized protein n=1 Tax=Dermacentor silvarum TaxID=543639 RepID=A0ACB8CV65_DERSI|nr:hypothetical protein HPB49_003666 [Dermacentor silvarum]